MQLGRLAGPFVSLPLPGLQCHSIGVVLKRHTSFTISGSGALFDPAFVDAFLGEGALKYANWGLAGLAFVMPIAICIKPCLIL